MSLSKSVEEFFGDSIHEVNYGQVKPAPLQFVNDALLPVLQVQ